MAFISTLENNKITLLPPFDHKEAKDEDDCGGPHNPILSDYAKYLWTSHTRAGGVQAPNRSRENTDGGGDGK